MGRQTRRLAHPATSKDSAPTRVLFSAERRARLIGHVEAGDSIEDACLAVGIGRSTVMRWQRKGRRDPESEAGEFARALGAARGAGRAIARRDLTPEDLVALLEDRAVERKCLKSIELLLTRPWEREDPPAQGRDEFSVLDELAGRREGRE